MAGQRHEKSDIVYDSRGNPDFTPVMKYETFIKSEQFYGKSRVDHMEAATMNLWQDIISGKVSASIFTHRQLKDIELGKSKIKDLTWHHDQQARRMQLVKESEHKKTGHTGSVGLNGGNKS
ncbi:HNH endonuclease [Candidatus Odyssella thessalonicensis]|uniref:HNH endonuclease n=1 Tax=Candidatus Odyssella thessalonicensis TaxID=84647 RepID=UPI00031D3E9C|nr:HNH endonuclease [Candidatus Odyssella thessalonicensis]